METIGVKQGAESSISVATSVESIELISLRGESERLRLERDNAQLRAELATLSKPWWRKGSVVTTLAALAAAILPVTTAIQAHYEKERELALQEGKQSHEIRTSYLDRLDKPGARLRTLRFVLATATDEPLRKWAQAETQEVQAEIHELDRRIEEIDKQLAAPITAPSSPASATPVDEATHAQRHVLEETRRKLLKIKSSALIDI